MRTAIVGGAAALASLVFQVRADDIKPFDAKPGLWEEVATTEISGLPPMPAIPPETLARMSDAQRKQVEAAMAARGGAGSPRTTTTKVCVTREQLDKGLAFRGSESDNCSTKVTNTAGKIQIHQECAPDKDAMNMKRVFDLTIERLDSEHMKGGGTMSMSGGSGAAAGRTMDAKFSMTGKWLGSDCGNVKPGGDGK